MELPPRKTRIQETTIRRNLSALDTLIQMGFQRHRAEKALASTGDKGVQFASNWLLHHVNDPMLDDPAPRDYILYLCPVGQLQREIQEFWQQSFAQCGWNRAHNYFPHITLCSFFKAEDAQVPQLAHAMKTIADQLVNVPQVLRLEYFASMNFIGLFVADNQAPFLKQITANYAEEVKKADVTVEPHRKQLHVSLAYQFQTDLKEKLEVLANKIYLTANARWDLRLYSRDHRIANCVVHKVIANHTPRAPDELELMEGDFIIFEESEIDTSPDGWYKGTSCMTGQTGMFPSNYTERAAETETWTMHRSIPIIGADTGSVASRLDNVYGAAGQLPDSSSCFSIYGMVNCLPTSDSTQGLSSGPNKNIRMPVITSESPHSLRRGQPGESPMKTRHVSSIESSRIHSHSQEFIPSLVPSRRSIATETNRTESCRPIIYNKPRQLYVIRHGERIDFTFGKDWVQMSFDSSAKYLRHDLNMPKWLPNRKGGSQDFTRDSPLTMQGQFQAKMIGEALKEKQIPIAYVYCSPSLRCVETASGILQGLDMELDINLEPGLFEWLGWYRAGLPIFMCAEELRSNGFSVVDHHLPVWPESKYSVHETTEQYYERCFEVTRKILQRHEQKGGNVLIVAHAASLDVCTRQLIGQQPRGYHGFHDILHKIPYVAMSTCQEDSVLPGKWHLVEPPVLPFAHTNNPKYSWTSLIASSASII